MNAFLKLSCFKWPRSGFTETKKNDLTRFYSVLITVFCFTPIYCWTKHKRLIFGAVGVTICSHTLHENYLFSDHFRVSAPVFQVRPLSIANEIQLFMAIAKISFFAGFPSKVLNASFQSCLRVMPFRLHLQVLSWFPTAWLQLILAAQKKSAVNIIRNKNWRQLYIVIQMIDATLSTRAVSTFPATFLFVAWKRSAFQCIQRNYSKTKTFLNHTDNFFDLSQFSEQSSCFPADSNAVLYRTPLELLNDTFATALC